MSLKIMTLESENQYLVKEVEKKQSEKLVMDRPTAEVEAGVTAGELGSVSVCEVRKRRKVAADGLEEGELVEVDSYDRREKEMVEEFRKEMEKLKSVIAV
eukprot:TRINITY_DN8553_c0_g1_i2.p3 TRINITY_DN8553_c0_g1~~TRINITY_DN8553_c0_g1_i2.p3  ORF type:complete len:100 (+),score=37.03 TRINITY_DN8553_c0_g1_i2:152-451(+)